MPQTTLPLDRRRSLLRLDPHSGTLRARSCRVTVLSGSKAGTVLAVHDILTLGSSVDAGLVLEDETVSRQHLRLEVRAEGVCVEDLHSTNGTYLSGVRVTELLVEEEATLVVGTTRVRVTVVDEDLGKPQAHPSFGDAFGASAQMRDLFGLLAQVAPTDSTVVLLGETGTGKDVLARSIHQKSHRSQAPFGVVDCAGLSSGVVESELFGHVKGAFTDAHSDRQGAFEAADGGTLFLDEIGELPLELQPRLLRFLETGTFRRLGENRVRRANVRIVAATHRDLPREVESGGFRQDLYYRLAVISLRVPALRERPEDIPVLAQHFASQASYPLELPKRFVSLLTEHTWPGNVRELRNAIQRALALHPTSQALERITRAEIAELWTAARTDSSPTQSERERILEALEKCQGNHTHAAKLLSISRGTLLARMDAHGIERPHLLRR